MTCMHTPDVTCDGCREEALALLAERRTEALEGILALLLLPYLDRSPKGVGVWFSRHRLLANTVFNITDNKFLLLVVINVFLLIVGCLVAWLFV